MVIIFAYEKKIQEKKRNSKKSKPQNLFEMIDVSVIRVFQKLVKNIIECS